LRRDLNDQISLPALCWESRVAGNMASDIGRLACDSLPHHRLDGAGRHQVDRGAESIGEVVFQLHEREEADRPGELDQNIDVACGRLLAAGDRAEDLWRSLREASAL